MFIQYVEVVVALWWGSPVVTKTPDQEGAVKVSCARQPALFAERPRGNALDQSHEAAIHYRNHHLHRPDIDTTGMDDIRKSLSKLKKDFKYRIGGKKRAAGITGANPAEETAGSSLSPKRPDSRVTASGRGEEGSRISMGVSQVHSRDHFPEPKPLQADEGSDNPQGREVDVECAGGSRVSREIKRASSPLLVASVPPKQEPDSTSTLTPQ